MAARIPSKWAKQGSAGPRAASREEKFWKRSSGREVSGREVRGITQHRGRSRETLMSEIVQKAINALRFLAVDAVEKSKSGHPGAPLGDAPIAYLLFHKYMRHNPKHAKWPNRDRFV